MSLDEELLNTYQADERFKIENNDQANWALRKISKIRKQRTEIKDISDLEIHRIEMWRNKNFEDLDKEEQYFLNLLRDYHSMILYEDPKRKTLDLPAGKCRFRAQPPEFKQDPERLLEWLERNKLDAFIRVKKEPAWGELKKLVKVHNGQVVMETGEIVEGVTAEEHGLSFRVEV